MFRILIIEDSTDSSSLLEANLEKTIKNSDKNLAWFSNWPSYKEVQYDIKTLGDKDLKSLTSVTGHSSLETAVRAIIEKEKIGKPDMVVLDLALTKNETNTIERNGGTDRTGLNRKTSSALEKITGFNLIKIFRELSCFVLVTSYSSNPVVEVLCLEQGANAFVLKPFSSDEMKVLVKLQDKDVLKNLCECRQELAKETEPRIKNYMCRIANETLKSIREIAIFRSCGASPNPVPFWLAVEKERVLHKIYPKSNLMLMDIRGFSKIVELVSASGKPAIIFDLINLIWSEIYEVLADYDAEVNNFIGDAALVFRGVYDYDEKDFELSSTLKCALELCQLFQPNGVIRTRMASHHAMEQLRNLDNFPAYHELLAFINDEAKFGFRIVVAMPDPDKALYGKVGANDTRWQHTILSRFMNMLARTESAVGDWEKSGAVKKSYGHCFLLWVKGKDKELSQLSTDGFHLAPPTEYLGKEREEIRDVVEGMEIYQVKHKEST